MSHHTPANKPISYDYSGHNAIVTGGTRGIGYATARLLAASGANVTITGRKQETVEPAAAALQAEAAELNPNAGRVIGIAAHVADPDAARRTCEATVQEFGSVDVLVNNAGTNPAYGPIHKQSPEAMAKTYEVNVIGPVIWTAAAKDAGMGADRKGAVVNLSSIGALTEEAKLGVYNGTKAALLHMTRQMANELAPTIHVNSIAPGVVRTKLSEALWKEHEDAVAAITPAQRIGEPEDIAAAIAFLAAPATTWLIGENLVVDGGMLVQPSVHHPPKQQHHRNAQNEEKIWTSRPAHARRSIRNSSFASWMNTSTRPSRSTTGR